MFRGWRNRLHWRAERIRWNKLSVKEKTRYMKKWMDFVKAEEKASRIQNIINMVKKYEVSDGILFPKRVIPRMTEQEVRKAMAYPNPQMIVVNPHNFITWKMEGNMTDLVNVYKVVRKTSKWNIFESALIEDEHKLIYPLTQMIRDFEGVGIFAYKTYEKAKEFVDWLKDSGEGDYYKGKIKIMRAKGRIINDNLPENPPMTAPVFLGRGIIDLSIATFSWNDDTSTVLCDVLQLIDETSSPVPMIAPWTEWEKPEKTYDIGDRIIIDSGKTEYILAQVDAKIINLINLKDGNRWSEPTKVEDVKKITREELDGHIQQGSAKWKWHKKEKYNSEEVIKNIVKENSKRFGLSK